MRKRLLISLLSVACLYLSIDCFSQDNNSFSDKVIDFPGKILDGIQKKSKDFELKLQGQAEKYLIRMEKKEEELYKKMFKFDSARAKILFEQSRAKYAALLQKIRAKENGVTGSISGEYLPYLDSIQGSLSFLKNANQLIKQTKALNQKLDGSLAEVKQLEYQLQQADIIKQFIRERKAQIQEVLSRYTILPAGITKSFDGLNKEIYYYSEQIREYREMLNDPNKMEQQALVILNKFPAFRKFMKENSILGGLFNVPNNYASAQALSGLQTRDQLQQIIAGRYGSGNNGQQAFQQSIQAAQTQLGQLKDKLAKLGGGSGDMEMPNFKPNTQRTKAFLQRLEYGVNLQTTHARRFFPTTSDLGFSLGFKIDDKKVIGIGASYRFGWGNGIQHISFSSQGVGLRSFIDVKAKGSFFVSGGLEYNYQQAFSSLTQIKNFTSWQRSGLIGMSKIVDMKSKVFKKTRIQLLYDFFYTQQVPRGQPLKFRIGYNF